MQQPEEINPDDASIASYASAATVNDFANSSVAGREAEQSAAGDRPWSPQAQGGALQPPQYFTLPASTAYTTGAPASGNYSCNDGNVPYSSYAPTNTTNATNLSRAPTTTTRNDIPSVDSNNGYSVTAESLVVFDPETVPKLDIDLKARWSQSGYVRHYEGGLKGDHIRDHNPYNLPLLKSGFTGRIKKPFQYKPDLKKNPRWHPETPIYCENPQLRSFVDKYLEGSLQKCQVCHKPLRFLCHWNLCDNFSAHQTQDALGRQLLGTQPYNLDMVKMVPGRKFTSSDLDAAYDNGHFAGKP